MYRRYFIEIKQKDSFFFFFFFFFFFWGGGGGGGYIGQTWLLATV